MTSRTTEIQRLIADIEGLLAHKGKRLHRVLAQEQDAREILERIRAFLVSLQESNAVGSLGETDGDRQQQLSPLLARFINQSSHISLGEEAQTSGELGISPRIDLRALLEPLQLEMQGLLQERAKLVEEIRHLEQKRLQNYSLAQQVANQEKMISEFLQVLMNRIRPDINHPDINYKADAPQQDLGVEVGQKIEQKALPQFGATSSSEHSSNLNPEALILSSTPALSDSLDQLQQLTRLTGDLDHRLLALDSTVNAVFNALERNIITYHDSLSQSLSRMHSKGVQGEKLLNNLIDNLSQRLRSDDTTQNVSQNQTTIENHTNFTNVDSLRSSTEDIQQSALMSGNETELESSEFSASIPDLDSVQLNSDSIKTDDYNAFPSNTESENPLSLELEDTQPPGNKSATSTNDIDELYASLFGAEDLIDTTENNNLQDSSHSTANITDTEYRGQSDKVDSYTAPGSEIFFGETPTLSSEVEDKELVRETDVSSYAEQNVADVTEEFIVDDLETPISHLEVSVEPKEESFNTDTQENTTSANTDSSIKESANPKIETTQTQEYNSIEAEHTPKTFTASEVMADMWNTFSFEEDIGGNTEENQKNEDNIITEEVPKPETLSPERAPESGTIPESDDLPKARDTIATLTDLLPELGIQADMFEVEAFTRTRNIKDRENQGNLDAVNLAENTGESSSVQTSNIPTSNISVSKDTSYNYLPASPEEDLLAEDRREVDTSKFDISLNPQQQKQLDWDLVNFDAEQTPQSQPEPTSTSAADLPKLEISAWETSPAESDLNPTGQCADTQLDLSPTLGLTEEIEKQNVATTDSQNSNLQTDNLQTDNLQTDNLKTNNLYSGTGDYYRTPVDESIKNSVWYLGIDLGTTGISAVLLNRSTQEVYPLYWSASSQSQLNSVQRSFRLPAEVYLPSSNVNSEQTSESSSDKASQAQANSPSNLNRNLFSAYLKPYLQVALSYKNDAETSLNKGRQKWEPLLQLNELSSIPLVWVVRSLSKLLLTFKSDRKSTTLGLTATADGLPSETFEQVINNLAGVICTCPSNSSEQYRFNVREALLTSKLVQHPQQVFFVEEAVAGLLSELDGARGETVKFRGSKRSLFPKSNSHSFVGNTLIVNIGASATEMGLVDVPQNLHELTHNKFMLHNFFYAGKAIEQDIVCQLLVPEKWRESRFSSSESTTVQNNASWRPSPGLEQMRLSSLGLDKLELPRPGEPDLKARIRLQQRLESSVLGQAILNAAGALKLILQQQESFNIELADQRWTLHRRDLESQVFVPFVRRLNREINRLLVARGIPTEAVDQAILTGGVASLGSVSRWLRQKLPNAKIIQDSYLNEDNTPKCTRVAYGLALLTLHPQVLEIPRQQYTDYFLFTELLQLLPQRAVSFGEIIQLFEGRGINTRSCQQRLLAFLEGELPQGLIPEAENSQWITNSSSENPYYKAIASAPLFEKQGSLTYRPNLEQLQHLRRYLDVIQASTQQSLKEPYTVNFVVGVQK